MIKNIEKGHTLLVRGPARITLVEGKIDVFGKIFVPEKEKSPSKTNDDNFLIIPGAQVYPLFSIDKSSLEIYTNSEENIKEIEDNSISPKWIEIKDAITKQLKQNPNNPLKIMVLGISSGKTTFIKYLANNFLKEGLKGAYLDSDLGQQIIYKWS